MDDYISAMDELRMCRLRLQFKNEYEPVPKKKPKRKAGRPKLGFNPEALVVERRMVQQMYQSLALKRSEAERNLKRQTGQLKYLLNMEKNGIASAGGQNPECCPVCLQTLESEVCFFF